MNQAKLKAADDLLRAVHEWEAYEIADAREVKAFDIQKIRARLTSAARNYEAIGPEPAKHLMQFEDRLLSYFGNGGLFNPEMMEHDKVRKLLSDILDAIRAARAQAEAKPGDVSILIDALEAIAVNEDRENLDGDSAEVALEQCNRMAEDALEEYKKAKPTTDEKPGDWMLSAALSILGNFGLEGYDTEEIDQVVQCIAKHAPSQSKRDLKPIVDDLSTLVCRLVRLFNKKPFQSDLPQKAMEYLVKNDLLGEPLRGSIPENEEERDAYDKLVKAIFPEAKPAEVSAIAGWIDELKIVGDNMKDAIWQFMNAPQSGASAHDIYSAFSRWADAKKASSAAIEAEAALRQQKEDDKP